MESFVGDTHVDRLGMYSRESGTCVSPLFEWGGREGERAKGLITSSISNPHTHTHFFITHNYDHFCCS